MAAEHTPQIRLEAQEAVVAGLGFLEAIQDPDGRLPSAKWRIERGEEVDLLPERAFFMTAFIASVLLGVPGAEGIVGRATRFAEQQREPGSVWQYLSTDDLFADSLPPDVDDTALAAMLLRADGQSVETAERVIMSNRDRAGRYFTWITFRGSWWRSPTRVRIFVRRMRRPRPLYNTFRFGSPRIRDVDAGVNANVVLHLGCRPETDRAVKNLLDVAGRGEVADRWYQDPLTLWFLISRALHRHGVAAGAVLVDRLRECTPTTPLQWAEAICVALDWGAPVPEDWVRRLLVSQARTGGWERLPFFFDAQTRWGGEATTTTLAVRALVSWLGAGGDASHDQRLR